MTAKHMVLDLWPNQVLVPKLVPDPNNPIVDRSLTWILEVICAGSGTETTSKNLVHSTDLLLCGKHCRCYGNSVATSPRDTACSMTWPEDHRR